MAQPYHKLPANFFNDDLPTAELQRNPNATEKTHLLVPNDSAGDGAVVVKAPHGGAKRSRIESAAREEELKFKIRKDKTKKKTTSVGGILYRLGHASAWCCLHIRYAIFIDAGILLTTFIFHVIYNIIQGGDNALFQIFDLSIWTNSYPIVQIVLIGLCFMGCLLGAWLESVHAMKVAIVAAIGLLGCSITTLVLLIHDDHTGFKERRWYIFFLQSVNLVIACMSMFDCFSYWNWIRRIQSDASDRRFAITFDSLTTLPGVVEQDEGPSYVHSGPVSSSWSEKYIRDDLDDGEARPSGGVHEVVDKYKRVDEDVEHVV